MRYGRPRLSGYGSHSFTWCETNRRISWRRKLLDVGLVLIPRAHSDIIMRSFTSSLSLLLRAASNHRSWLYVSTLQFLPIVRNHPQSRQAKSQEALIGAWLSEFRPFCPLKSQAKPQSKFQSPVLSASYIIVPP